MDENGVTISETESSSLAEACEQESLGFFFFLISFHYNVYYLLSEGHYSHFIVTREVSVICKTRGE